MRGARHCRVNAGAALNYDVAIDLTGCSIQGRGKAPNQIIADLAFGRDAVVEKIRVALCAGRLIVANVQRRRDQAVNVDLRAAAEDDSVLIDDVDAARRVDAAEYLARTGAAGGNPVERDPVGTALKKIQRGVRADVECLPVQDRLR